MTSLEIKEQIDRIFLSIEESSILSKLNDLIMVEGIDPNFTKFKEKYPELNFRIRPEEIRQLKEEKVLTSDNILAPSTFGDRSPLEKLLLSILWKTGQLDRVSHISKGIQSIGPEKSSDAFIFNQFGMSLANPIEPIVDRHVLRVFCLWKVSEKSASDIEKVRRKKYFNDDRNSILPQYKSWFSSIVQRVQEEDRDEYKYKLDKFLFHLGKRIQI